MNIDRNSVGYTEAGARFDYFCFSGLACIVDTATKSTSVWKPIHQAKAEAGYLNSGFSFEI